MIVRVVIVTMIVRVVVRMAQCLRGSGTYRNDSINS
jgi:predicted nucleic acid-binding Zn ribbon protein